MLQLTLKTGRHILMMTSDVAVLHSYYLCSTATINYLIKHKLEDNNKMVCDMKYFHLRFCESLGTGVRIKQNSLQKKFI